MLPESFKEIIDFAIEKETESAGFYRNASDLMESDNIKSFFKEMAAEEEKHKMLLIGIDDKTIKLSEVKKVPDLGIAEFLSETSFDLGLSYGQALTLAIKSEQKSLEFYRGLAKHASEPELKRLFHILEQEEAKHKLRLEEVYSEEVLLED